MDRETLNAGKKAAEALAPDPEEHTPEAPVISEKEAQAVVSPEGSEPSPTPEEIGPDDVRREAGTSAADDAIHIKPDGA